MTEPFDANEGPDQIQPSAEPKPSLMRSSAVNSGASEDDYWSLREGGTDPVLKKSIHVLIGKDKDFVVYLDDLLGIQWSDRRPNWPRPEVLNKVARLEAESSFITNPKTLRDIRCQIGEGLVRALSEPTARDSVPDAPMGDMAMDILNAAEQWIILENRTVSRRWLTTAASVLGVTCAAALALTVGLSNFAGWQLAFATAMAGGIGAWVSVLNSRQTMDTIDARTGRSNHILEAFARVMVGVIGAFLLALLVQGEFVMKFVGSVPALMIGFGLACGASERLLPSLIASVERAGDSAEGTTQGADGKAD